MAVIAFVASNLGMLVAFFSVYGDPAYPGEVKRTPVWSVPVFLASIALLAGGLALECRIARHIRQRRFGQR